MPGRVIPRNEGDASCHPPLALNLSSTTVYSPRTARSKHERIRCVSTGDRARASPPLIGCSSGYADPDADLYEDVDPSPLTAEESERVPRIATEAYQTLYSQDKRVRLLQFEKVNRADTSGRACSSGTSLPSYER